MLATLVAYSILLLLVSHHATRHGAKGNDAFFRAGRQSPWWMVAFGMIGASISGVTFISVPGWAASTGMTYLQMCLGFIVGYVVVPLCCCPSTTGCALPASTPILAHVLALWPIARGPCSLC